MGITIHYGMEFKEKQQVDEFLKELGPLMAKASINIQGSRREC
ncbi:MAG: hypothetical protein ABIG96_06110 [Candidatus Micrarchaeota archaeon]